MAEITPETRGAQLESRHTFLGLDANRLARWDMRTGGGVVEASPVVAFTGDGKDYARGTNLTCMATSGDGYCAVGSKDGQIRLYSDKSLKQAKTAIPGLGQPVTSIDVTFDGRWVLATTDSYLLVVNAIFSRDGAEKNGFKERLGRQMPVPRMLKLKPQDALMTAHRPLREAKFTWVTEKGKQERWIVASCGSNMVIWNFAKVKAAPGEATSYGGLPTNTDYFLRAKDEELVVAAFMHDRYCAHGGGGASGSGQNALVVATPHKLYSVAS